MNNQIRILFNIIIPANTNNAIILPENNINPHANIKINIIGTNNKYLYIELSNIFFVKSLFYKKLFASIYSYIIL